MFHVSAFSASLTTPADGAVAALQDDVITIQNSRFLLQSDMMLIAAASFLLSQTRCRFVTPSLRQVAIPYLRPVNAVANPATDPNVVDYRRAPLRIKATEEFYPEISGTDVGAQRATVLAFLESRPEPMIPGDIYTLRGTGTTTLVANAWTSIVPTWQDTLPNGTYAVVGATFQSATCVAGRLIFEDQRERPGAVGVTALANRTHDMFHKGGLGVWGRFRNYALPTPQFLATAADTTQEVYLDLVRLS